MASTETIRTGRDSQHEIDKFIRRLVKIIETSIGGSGVAVAGAGLLNVGATIFHAHPFGNFQTHYLDEIFIAGWLLGGIVGWINRK